MASLKFSLREYKDLFYVIIRLYHNRKNKPISTGYKVERKEHLVYTDKHSGDAIVVKNKYIKNPVRANTELQDRIEVYRNRIDKLKDNNSLHKLTITELYDIITNPDTGSFSGAIKKYIDFLEDSGKFNTSKNYRTCRKFWFDFFDLDIESDTIYFSDITLKTLELAEQKYLTNGTVNGFWTIIKNTRATFNRAIKHNETEPEVSPFSEYNIQPEKTRKRAIKKSDLIKLFEYKGNQFETEAIEFYKVSFYNVGMSIREICLLKVENIKYGTLEYKRGKSKDLFTWEIQEPIKHIIDNWTNGKEQNEYLINEINQPISSKQLNKKIASITSRVNNQLKSICKKIEIPEATTYSARHSWANIARESGIEIEVISEALGHEELKTTLIYLNEIDTKTVNEANRKITQLLK